MIAQQNKKHKKRGERGVLVNSLTVTRLVSARFQFSLTTRTSPSFLLFYLCAVLFLRLRKRRRVWGGEVTSLLSIVHLRITDDREARMHV
jgi:hypothetical protein